MRSFAGSEAKIFRVFCERGSLSVGYEGMPLNAPQVSSMERSMTISSMIVAGRGTG